MACGILLITHPGIGHALLRVATALLQQLPLKIEAFEVPLDVDLDTLLPHASAAMHRVNNGEGVLIMTDLYGASPSNLAHRLAQLDARAPSLSPEPTDAITCDESPRTKPARPACHGSRRNPEWSNH